MEAEVPRSRAARAAAQGPQAYAEQMLLDHPELDRATLEADAILAVAEFHARLLSVR